MKIESLQSVPAGSVNTPLEPMPRLAAALGMYEMPKREDRCAGTSACPGGSDGWDCGLYIKRDDLTGLALGGNKVRKLNYIVQYALAHGYTALMTFGGVQTNHGRLTVAAAVRYGLKPILVLKGPKPDYLSGNLLLDRLMGADLYFVDADGTLPSADASQTTAAKQKQKFLDDCAARITAAYEAKGYKVLSVPVGGQTVIGSAGYIQAVPEIMAQMKARNIRAKHLVAGYGSTGTFAGLWAGARYYHAPFEVIGIPVEPDWRPLEETADFINELSRYFEMGFTCRKEDLHLETGVPDAGYGGAGRSESNAGYSGSGRSKPDFGYGGTGYNEPDAVTQRCIELLARTEAIFVDPCYTGKVFHGYVDLLKRGILSARDGAIFLHTGGTPGLWSKEHLDSMQDSFWSDEEKDHVHVMTNNKTGREPYGYRKPAVPPESGDADLPSDRLGDV